eukprot:CAMPEP_0173389814 /NCGR_PEP_ID=MMETSP1356-20130122/13561_1 /TAXON_ID=77927 ORGANISM="Hemiselmis virescens, Strain PCC157" /NCGR_SAMPLE_ID=MMETSP1356 /ASSEMBLY_ACC=CAM_ASM_000847 /LENGTH=61 /DNA_ID=CAMNT_0014347067 /DNA_START=365 /DNA_END=550 /DNA_ORIENTATION=-
MAVVLLGARMILAEGQRHLVEPAQLPVAVAHHGLEAQQQLLEGHDAVARRDESLALGLCHD